MKLIIIFLSIIIFASCTKPVSESDNPDTPKKKVYYRITQVDFDGKQSHSRIVAVME